MRHAVPLIRSEAPIVGTGIEKQVCEDSRTMITAEGNGVIEYVDATTIRIAYDRTEDEEFVRFDANVKEYDNPKIRRTHQAQTTHLPPPPDPAARPPLGAAGRQDACARAQAQRGPPGGHRAGA